MPFPISFNTFLVGISDFAYTDGKFQWKLITQFNGGFSEYANFLFHSFNRSNETTIGVRFIVIGY